MEATCVQDWMTREVITVTDDGSLPEARRLMEEHGIRHLPVLENGELVGMVTWGDIRQASASDAEPLQRYELGYLLRKLSVSKIMTNNPITISPTASIAEAAQIMLDHKIGSLPVVASGCLIGIITEGDLFRMMVLAQAA